MGPGWWIAVMGFASLKLKFEINFARIIYLRHQQCSFMNYIQKIICSPNWTLLCHFDDSEDSWNDAWHVTREGVWRCDGRLNISTEASLLCPGSVWISRCRSHDTHRHTGGEDGGFNSNSQAHLRVLQNKRLCKRVLNSCLWLGLHISVCSCQAALLRFTEWKNKHFHLFSVTSTSILNAMDHVEQN